MDGTATMAAVPGMGGTPRSTEALNTLAATPQDFPVLLSLLAPWDGLLAWVEGEAAPAGGRVGAGGPAMLHRSQSGGGRKAGAARPRRAGDGGL